MKKHSTYLDKLSVLFKRLKYAADVTPKARLFFHLQYEVLALEYGGLEGCLIYIASLREENIKLKLTN